ncbi:MAG: MaoC/PaaZ C-terminal domain-containing protein, partial [Candidatus Sericytochromatia bacterium]
ATCRSLYQVRRAAPRSAGPRPAPEPAEALSGAREPWRLDSDEGRRYARLSGDYNPIHLSPWTSQLFGFRRPILHGMDAAARVQAGIERGTGLEVSALEIAFKRPIALPASVEWAWEPAGDGFGRYAIDSADGATRHLEGRYAT